MFYSAAHKCLIYDHASPGQVCATIPGARQLSDTKVAVPTDLHSLQIARLLNLPAPPIMEMSGYDWPMEPGKRPYTHQRHMANFHVLHPRGFNLGEMGVGKSLSVLWAADYLMRMGVIQRCLIISPLSTLRRVWADEIMRNFLGRRTSIILHGSHAQRVERLAEKHDFYIVNHDGLAVGTTGAGHHSMGDFAGGIQQRADINLIIADECSAYKDNGSRRTKVLKKTIGDKSYIWLLSGTPTPQAPTDAYALAKIVGGLPGESFYSFQNRTMRKITNFKWAPRSDSAAVVAKALSPAIRYSREECIDLPECVVETRDVPLSPTQEKAYKDLKKNLQVSINQGQTITAVNEAVVRLKLIQIACGAVYGHDREVHKTDAAPRISVLKEVIDEAGAKILVFAPFTAVVDMLYSELRSTYGTAAVARVYGQTGQKARDDIFIRFDQDPELRIIVCDPQTMSHGLNLQAANTTVWFGPTDRLETYDQANARMTRPGQKNKMLIVRLASTPVEREIYKRLEQKQSLQGAILTLVEEDR